MKAKTHSGSKKRIKITGTGKFRTGKIGKRHLLGNKSSQSKGKNKYGSPTHVANERKMKVALQVQGLRTPAKKKIERKAPKAFAVKTFAAPVARPAKSSVATPKTKKAPAKKAAPATTTAKTSSKKPATKKAAQ